MGSERGEQPLSCNNDDRCLRQKQEGVVGAVASRMQGPLKGRSIRWEPQPVQGRGVSRGREGGVETPLSPSGPAERPRRRCILQKASDLPYATTLCAGKDDLELPPLRSGNRSGRIIFKFATLENLRIFQSCFFTGGAVPGSCICSCWPAAHAQRSDPGGDASCKRHQTCPTRPPSAWEAASNHKFLDRAPHSVYNI